MGKHTYFPSSRDDEKREKALKAAKRRGKAAEEWFSKGNKLTPETKPEFDKLMKEVTKNESK